jgi:hypothetical protein
MRFTPVLVFHICVGILGLLSGAAALSVRKGSVRHLCVFRVRFTNAYKKGLSRFRSNSVRFKLAVIFPQMMNDCQLGNVQIRD